MLTRLLRCPRCGSELALADDAVCSGGHRFAVVDGIPVFLACADLPANKAESLIERARSVGLEPLDVPFRLSWWCEARDRRPSDDRRGSMQLSVVFARG